MTAPESSSLVLRLPVAVESVSSACTAVLGLCGPDLSARSRTTVELVLEEVTMNLRMHAFEDPRGRSFELEAWRDGDALRLRFRDEGRPFDPVHATAGALPGNLAHASPGGLGLHLLRRRARSMAYARRNGRNELTIELGLERTRASMKSAD